MILTNLRYPAKLKLLDIEYQIAYVDTPSEVDLDRRDSMWGQTDYWSRSIRILVNDGMLPADVWNSIWHETLHALCDHLKLRAESEGLIGGDETLVNLLAVGINTIVRDNGWLAGYEVGVDPAELGADRSAVDVRTRTHE